ncbi:FecCD family ABC transporter permease [Nakamurella leprariae]|uniref:FecCD family ABC transporter permease n=1 Tax=Nakamurella leprariae TaxID=2803911 RepID=UPI002E2CFFF7|nr:iron chelate uptake ABC transporter family permease subunit [Nakamurella leprariae]
MTSTRPRTGPDTVTGTDALRWPRGIAPVRFGGFSTRIELRAAALTVLFLLVALAVAVWSLTVGSAGIGVAQVWSAFTGTASTGTSRIVLEWRLPRVVFALLGGAALAIGGAVFQSITRNPLGSPDIIGFSSGAYTGALIAGLIATGSAVGTSIGALTGALLTGVAVHLLAFKRGVSATRIVVIGVGLSMFLSAFNSWLLTTMQLEAAITAASWGAGSLAEIAWGNVLPVVIGLVVCGPVVLWLAADMRMLEMGDDAGRGVGVRAETVRVVLLLMGVLLIALVTASAGPIAFVALAAPQLAMRLTGTPGIRILPAAVFGALLLAASDLVARTVIAPTQLPVGVVTLCLGGAYLVWLLATSRRGSRR